MLPIFNQASEQDIIIFDSRFESYGPYDYVLVDGNDVQTDIGAQRRKLVLPEPRYTMAEMAAQAGVIHKLGRYWWHDPHYVSLGNTHTVAMHYYAYVSGRRFSDGDDDLNDMPALDPYWWHEPDFQVLTYP